MEASRRSVEAAGGLGSSALTVRKTVPALATADNAEEYLIASLSPVWMTPSVNMTLNFILLLKSSTELGSAPVF